ncbi:uncharacterized protein ACN427_000614 isoform 1-T3 [Glossina fuscipes fuscipes]
MEALLNEFHQSESDGDIVDNVLCIKNKVFSKPKEKRTNTPKTVRKHLLSLSKKRSKEINPTSRVRSTFQRQESIPINLRSPNELRETPNRNSLQTETTTSELGEFRKNGVETTTPYINRKLSFQEMDKDLATVLTLNLQKKWRLSGLKRTRTSSKK